MEASKGDETERIRSWICDRLRSIRMIRGLTQRQLACAVNIDASRVSDLERGVNDIKISSIIKCAGYLGTNLEVFFRGCPSMKPVNVGPQSTIIVTDRVTLLRTLLDARVEAAAALEVADKLTQIQQ